MHGWVSTDIRGSEISKKDLEVDGFATIGNFLRGRRRSENRMTGAGSERMKLSADGILSDREYDPSHELADSHAGLKMENEGARRTVRLRRDVNMDIEVSIYY